MLSFFGLRASPCLPLSCELVGKEMTGRDLWGAQESLKEGCTKVDEIVESFSDVGLKDRSMVWNTDLVEVCAEAGGPGNLAWLSCLM